MTQTPDTSPSQLVVGIADFQDPTLLILGEASSFGRLADLMESAVHGTHIHFSKWGRCVNVKLTLSFDSIGGLKRIGDRLVWQISLEEASHFAQQLRSLAASTTAGHHYLDPATNDAGLQVVASLGEYDPSTIFGK